MSAPVFNLEHCHGCRWPRATAVRYEGVTYAIPTPFFCDPNAFWFTTYQDSKHVQFMNYRPEIGETPRKVNVVDINLLQTGESEAGFSYYYPDTQEPDSIAGMLSSQNADPDYRSRTENLVRSIARSNGKICTINTAVPYITIVRPTEMVDHVSMLEIEACSESKKPAMYILYENKDERLATLTKDFYVTLRKGGDVNCSKAEWELVAKYLARKLRRVGSALAAQYPADSNMRGILRLVEAEQIELSFSSAHLGSR